MAACLRQRGHFFARRICFQNPRGSRSYASQSHGKSDATPAANESLGTAFYIFAGVVPASFLLYFVSRPGKTGEPSRFTKYIERLADLGRRWEERNTLHTAAIEQAAQDRHLFTYVPRSNHVDLRFPEIFQTGSPHNVPAGHSVNLDKVVAHYRQQHLNEEERKANRAAARSTTGHQQA